MITAKDITRITTENENKKLLKALLIISHFDIQIVSTKAER